jgi:hypothetical protein
MLRFETFLRCLSGLLPQKNFRGRECMGDWEHENDRSICDVVLCRIKYKWKQTIFLSYDNYSLFATKRCNTKKPYSSLPALNRRSWETLQYTVTNFDSLSEFWNFLWKHSSRRQEFITARIFICRLRLKWFSSYCVWTLEKWKMPLFPKVIRWT